MHYIQIILLGINLILLSLLIFFFFKTSFRKRKHKIYLKSEISNSLEKETNKQTRVLEISVINKLHTDVIIQGLGLYFKHHTINFLNNPQLVHSNEVFRLSIDVNKIVEMLKNQPYISYKNMKYYLKNNFDKLLFIKSKHLLHFINETYTL